MDILILQNLDSDKKSILCITKVLEVFYMEILISARKLGFSLCSLVYLKFDQLYLFKT